MNGQSGWFEVHRQLCVSLAKPTEVLDGSGDLDNGPAADEPYARLAIAA